MRPSGRNAMRQGRSKLATCVMLNGRSESDFCSPRWSAHGPQLKAEPKEKPRATTSSFEHFLYCAVLRQRANRYSRFRFHAFPRRSFCSLANAFGDRLIPWYFRTGFKSSWAYYYGCPPLLGWVQDPLGGRQVQGVWGSPQVPGRRRAPHAYAMQIVRQQADLRQLVRGLIAAGQVVHPPVVD
jgi:hypothetical protein